MSDRDLVTSLYNDLLQAWNRRTAEGFAGNFAEDGEVVGFDGSETKGRDAIASEMQRVFMDHETGQYVGKIRQVRLLTPQVALVRAVAGIVPAGESDLNPALNSVQALVLQKLDDRWLIVLYQNTPAPFHGRTELVKSLTDELRKARTSKNR
jgi:uncharacterized protein (TIGR02246 family)